MSIMVKPVGCGKRKDQSQQLVRQTQHLKTEIKTMLVVLNLCHISNIKTKRVN